MGCLPTTKQEGQAGKKACFAAVSGKMVGVLRGVAAAGHKSGMPT